MPLDFQTPSPTIEPLFHQELEGNVYFFADYYGEGQQLYRIPNTISSVEESEKPELMTVSGVYFVVDKQGYNIAKFVKE